MTAGVPSPAGDPEDRRQAASMAVGISSAVTSASLTLLGVLAVIVTFTADKYSHLFVFYVLIGVSAMLLICAIIAGVQGTAEILREGASGVWKTKTEKRLFDRQALLAGLALVAVAAAVPVGPLVRPARRRRSRAHPAPADT